MVQKIIAPKKFYAVKRGRVPGVYHTWKECYQQVKDYPNAKYKSFVNVTDAFDYLDWQDQDKLKYIDNGRRQRKIEASRQKDLERAIQKIRVASKRINQTRKVDF